MIHRAIAFMFIVDIRGYTYQEAVAWWNKPATQALGAYFFYEELDKAFPVKS
jgi:hypothetical protein